MMQDYWWLIFVGLALLAVLVLWLIVGRRKGVGTEAAASLRDLDGSQAARPTFARPDPMSTPPPLATGPSAGPDAALFARGPEAEGPSARGPISVEVSPEPAEPNISPFRPAPSEQVPTAPTPVPAPPPIDAPAGSPTGDDLTRMKGLGPKLRDRLVELGVTRFDQIAGWDEAEVDRIDGQLGRFAGRIRRDDWVEQARFLAADDRAGYEARFGALGG